MCQPALHGIERFTELGGQLCLRGRRRKEKCAGQSQTLQRMLVQAELQETAEACGTQI